MESFLPAFSFCFILLFLLSLLTFWGVGQGYCHFGRIFAAALIQSALLTLLFVVVALYESEVLPLILLLAVLTVPYALSRLVLRLPRLRSAIAVVLCLLLLLIAGTIGYSSS